MVIFNSIKTVGTILVSFLALFGFWKYKNKEEEVTELKSYAEQKDKEVQAMKQTVEVQERVYQQEVSNFEMEKEVQSESAKTGKENIKRKNEMHLTVDNAVEGEEFDLKA